jgi:hypothetical protein
MSRHAAAALLPLDAAGSGMQVAAFSVCPVPGDMLTVALLLMRLCCRAAGSGVRSSRWAALRRC